MKFNNLFRRGLLAAAFCLPGFAAAQDGPSPAELAKQLSNPVASLISVPLQLNFDSDIGPDDDGDRVTLNIQPVIPFELSQDWNLISRTILPLVDQSDIFPGAGDQSGTGDIVQSLFFSPKSPTDSGWIWGVGPVFLLPTGSDDLLTADKTGVGPTAVALKQDGPWTYGALANHIESVAGDDDRDDVRATFLQPFLVYGTPEGVSYAINMESTYDWEAEQASVPINMQINKVGRIGSQMIQFGGGLRYWADSPDGGPEGWGLRLNFVLLYPK
jgi:hypothetical protein